MQGKSKGWLQKYSHRTHDDITAEFQIVGVSRNPLLPNTACTRLVGVAAFSGSFLAQGWFRQSGVISSHPPAGNAHRWAFVNNQDKDRLIYNKLWRLILHQVFISYKHEQDYLVQPLKTKLEEEGFDVWWD